MVHNLIIVYFVVSQIAVLMHLLILIFLKYKLRLKLILNDNCNLDFFEIMENLKSKL